MRKFKLAAYVAVLCLLLGCKKSDPDPAPVPTGVNMEYYFDGVRYVPFQVGAFFIGDRFFLSAPLNNTLTGLVIQLDSAGLSPNTYSFIENNTTSTEYIAVNDSALSNAFYTSVCPNGNNNAFLTISSVDLVNSTMSGTFGGTMCGFAIFGADSLEHTVSGSFTNLSFTQ